MWALGARFASRTLSAAVQGRASVSREQAQRSAPPWGLQRPRVSRERLWPPEHVWGRRADTLERQCSHLPAFPMPRHLSGRGGAPAGPRQPGRDAQGPDAPGSRFLPLSVPLTPAVGGLCPTVLQPAFCTNTPPARPSVCRHRFRGPTLTQGSLISDRFRGPTLTQESWITELHPALLELGNLTARDGTRHERGAGGRCVTKIVLPCM